ncbi:MAG: hypothetical protein COC01_03295 [Bacteroidetes bacterium]|nr:MAG: hypothetical protein COC01_03295 [Bacteroidota bacterium]
MEVQEEKFKEEDSLLIIQEMIQTAKSSFNENGFQFLLWGWVVIIAGMGQYSLFMMGYKEYSSYPWFLTLPAAIYSGIYGYRFEKKMKVKTHVDTIINYLWGGFMISLILTMVFCVVNKVQVTSYILLLCGIGTFTTGGALKFKPLIWGGILFWAFAILAIVFNGIEQLLINSIAIFVGYLIPGYILRKKFKDEAA